MTGPRIPRFASIFLLFAAAAAGQVLYQTGFEAPTFTLGPINGQDTWTSPPDIVIQNTFTNGGSQAASLTPTVVASLLASRSISNYSVSSQGNLVRIKIDMFLSSSGTPSNWAPIVTAGSNGFMSQLLVLGSTAKLLGSSTVGAVPVTRGVWNTYQLDLDMTAQTATASVNTTPIGSTGFANSPGNIFNRVQFGLNSLPGSDNATFDNLSITTPNAPPPPSVTTVPALSGPGLAALAVLLLISAFFLMRRHSAA